MKMNNEYDKVNFHLKHNRVSWFAYAHKHIPFLHTIASPSPPSARTAFYAALGYPPSVSSRVCAPCAPCTPSYGDPPSIFAASLCVSIYVFIWVYEAINYTRYWVWLIAIIPLKIIIAINASIITLLYYAPLRNNNLCLWDSSFVLEYLAIILLNINFIHQCLCPYKLENYHCWCWKHFYLWSCLDRLLAIVCLYELW